MIRKTAFAASLFLAACSADSNEPVEPTGEQEAASWSEAYAQDEAGKADGTGCSGIVLPDQGDFGGRIALTFDDGPHATHTPEVMEVLRAHAAPAAFFMKGQNVKTYPGLAKEIIADPNFIAAHHSWSHTSLVTVTGSKLDAEIDKTMAAFAELDFVPTMLRPPYGAYNCATKAAVDARNLTVVGWHVDSADWSYGSGNGTARWDGVPSRFKSDMTGYVIEQTNRHNGGVLLFHDIQAYTASELDGLMTKLENLGYTFVSLEDTLTFPRLNGLEPPFIGDACEDDADCEFTAAGKAAYCIGSSVCVIDCAGSCPDAGGKATTYCVADPRNGVEGGICVSKAVELNNFCESAPQTVAVEAERYVGASGARSGTAKVCMPQPVE